MTNVKSRFEKEIKEAKEANDPERAESYEQLDSSLDVLEDTVFNILDSRSETWRNGFIAGYATAVVGIGLGVVASKIILRYIDKHTEV